MKYLPILLACNLLSAYDQSYAQSGADAPQEVLDLLEQASGQLYAKVGNVAAVCNAKGRANGRAVIVEGRRFADAISFTSLLGWYAPRQQIVGLFVFENGESLLLRATIRREDEKLTAEGDVIGVLRGKEVKATCEATRGSGAWSVKVLSGDDEPIHGHIRSTGR